MKITATVNDKIVLAATFPVTEANAQHESAKRAVTEEQGKLLTESKTTAIKVVSSITIEKEEGEQLLSRRVIASVAAAVAKAKGAADAAPSK